MSKYEVDFKKMLATTAVAAAAIVVPTTLVSVEAAPNNAIQTVDGLLVSDGAEQKINYTLNIDLEQLYVNPTTPFIVEKYEWFYVEGENQFPIADSATKSMKVPLEALGKEIQVKITGKLVGAAPDETTVFWSNKHKVEPIDIKIDIDLIGNENPAIDDIVTVGPLSLMDGGMQLPFEDKQVSYSFQWYVAVGNTYEEITGATERTLNLTKDLLNQKIVVKVTADIIGQTYATFSNVIDFDEILDEVQSIDEGISSLIIPNSNYQDSYSSFDYDAFIEKVGSLRGQYNSLAKAAKGEINNLEILQEAEKDIVLVGQFVKSLKNAQLKIPSVDMNRQIQLTEKQLKELETIQNSLQSQYDNLDSLEVSILQMYEDLYDEVNYKDLMESLATILENRKYDAIFTEISEINSELSKLLNPEPNVDDVSINVDSLRTEYTETLVDVQSIISTLQKRIAKVEKQYRPYIYTNILKQVEGDIKRAQAVVKRIDTIKVAKTAKKKSTAEAAYKTYIALTPLQKTLITQDQYELMIDSQNEELDSETSSKFDEMNKAITDLIDDSIPAYSGTLEDISLQVNGILGQYKALTSVEKKRITQYTLLKAAEKDIKAVQKVAKLLAEAQDLEIAITGETEKLELSQTKKAISKYKAAITAFSKLTMMQQTLISDNSLNETLESYGALVEAASALEAGESDVELDPSVLTLNESIALLINGNVYAEGLRETVLSLTNKYKELNSKERKAVYNYAILKTATSDIKKADGVFAKLRTAAEDADQKKYDSALKLYNNLSALQQSLIKLEDINIANLTDATGIVTAIDTNIKDIQDQFNVADEVDAAIYDEIAAVEAELKTLTSSQKKQLKNASILKSIQKDVSAVKSFINKLTKLGYNPPLASKETILNSYYKLTESQVKLFKANTSNDVSSESYYERLVGYENDLYNRTQTAKSINAKIAEILNQYVSIVELNEILASIDSEYANLAAADRKLVTNYSKLNQVKKDITAVLNVKKLKDELDADLDSSSYKKAQKAWQRAFNKLNARQLELYYM